MIYLILKSPAPLVRTLCKPVTDFGKSLDCLVADLFETLGHSERPGIGLSANQVGDLRRVFVVGDSKSFAAAAFVNPGITKSRGSKTAMEGCLSLKPEDDRPVTRAEIINTFAILPDLLQRPQEARGDQAREDRPAGSTEIVLIPQCTSGA